MRRHLVSLADLSDVDVSDIARRGLEHARSQGRERGCALSGLIVGTYFRVTSTRTRTAFSVGALRLGGQIVAYGPNDLQLNTGETTEDTTRVLSGMLDGLVARTAGPGAELRSLAAQQRMAVINAMSADEHPTQALADLTTLLQEFGRLDGLRLLYVGEGNNTAAALALALTRFRGCELHLRTPRGYGLEGGVMTTAVAQARRSAAAVEERHDLDDLPAAVDAVYTTRWQTTGTVKPDAAWRDAFAPFQVDADLAERWPRAVIMHDLPAHRGEEVTASMLDGPRSIAFRQAENKLYSAMAVLEWCLAPWHPSGTCGSTRG
jgi:ornithine carbamoyltransferase